MKKLSWQQVEEVVEQLGEIIKTSGFKPDYIIGITTGGLIPLYFLAKKLSIDNILTVSATSYEKDKQKELKITYLPSIDLQGKKLLLVDEITETGASLKGVVETIKTTYSPAELKTATLVINKDKGIFFPDFFVLEEKGEWIVFPWEKEDFPEYFIK
jgi:uncharacterized protein